MGRGHAFEVSAFACVYAWGSLLYTYTTAGWETLLASACGLLWAAIAIGLRRCRDGRAQRLMAALAGCVGSALLVGGTGGPVAAVVGVGLCNTAYGAFIAWTARSMEVRETSPANAAKVVSAGVGGAALLVVVLSVFSDWVRTVASVVLPLGSLLWLRRSTGAGDHAAQTPLPTRRGVAFMTAFFLMGLCNGLIWDRNSGTLSNEVCAVACVVICAQVLLTSDRWINAHWCQIPLVTFLVAQCALFAVAWSGDGAPTSVYNAAILLLYATFLYTFVYLCASGGTQPLRVSPSDVKALPSHLERLVFWPPAVLVFLIAHELAVAAAPFAPMRLMLAALLMTPATVLVFWCTLARPEVAPDGRFKEVALEGRGLTPREIQVILSFARGRSIKGIAQDESISVNTVKSHIAHAYVKLGVHSRDELRELLDG